MLHCYEKLFSRKTHFSHRIEILHSMRNLLYFEVDYEYFQECANSNLGCFMPNKSRLGNFLLNHLEFGPHSHMQANLQSFLDSVARKNSTLRSKLPIAWKYFLFCVLFLKRYGIFCIIQVKVFCTIQVKDTIRKSSLLSSSLIKIDNSNNWGWNGCLGRGCQIGCWGKHPLRSRESLKLLA